MANELINTKQVTDYRTVRFTSLQEILDDAERCGEHARTTGNWTPAMIVNHVRKLITRSRQGFDFKAPWFVRLMGMVMKPFISNKPPPRGLKLPGDSAKLLSSPDVTWDEAIASLRNEVQKINDGDRMEHRSPLFGALSHEKWVMLHCGHAALHFGFMHPVEDSDA